MGRTQLFGLANIPLQRPAPCWRYTMRQGPSSRGQRWESAPPPPEAGAASGSPRMEGPCWEEVTGQGRLTPRVLSGARGGGVSEWAVGRVSGSWGRLLAKTWGDVRWFWGLCIPLQPCPARPPRGPLRPPLPLVSRCPEAQEGSRFPRIAARRGHGQDSAQKVGARPTVTTHPRTLLMPWVRQGLGGRRWPLMGTGHLRVYELGLGSGDRYPPRGQRYLGDSVTWLSPPPIWPWAPHLALPPPHLLPPLTWPSALPGPSAPAPSAAAAPGPAPAAASPRWFPLAASGAPPL